MQRCHALAVAVVVSFALVEGALATRQDLDDHARFTASVYMTAARNYVRHGFLEEWGVPLINGGALELARESRYLSWPVREFLEVGVWFSVFGPSVPVARARTVFWVTLALLALASRGRADAPLWPLAFGSCPFVLYYAHAAVPQVVTVSAVAVAAAARLRRLEGGGRRALLVQVLALVLAVSTTWEGILFALAFALSDVWAGRRDGLLVLGVAAGVCLLEIAAILALGGGASVFATAARRASSPGPILETLIRIVRYGRSLGYGHALLTLAGLVVVVRRLRARTATPTDRLALELLLAPLPWFFVFRQHVALHDIQLMYFAPGVATAAWIALRHLRGRTHGRLRVVLAAGMLVVTGAGVAAIVEHRDDWSLPRLVGAAARETSRPDEAVATSTAEHSVIWEADRYVHLGVASVADLERVRRHSASGFAPAWFVLPEAEERTALGLALAHGFPSRRYDGAIAFDLRGD
jgi:hypothetical protein